MAARKPRRSGGVEGSPGRERPKRGAAEQPGHRKGELGDEELDQARTARRPRERSRAV